MVIRISSQINPRRRRARDAIKRKLTEGIESICSRTRYQENKMKQPFSCQLFQVSFTQKIGGNNTCTRHSHTRLTNVSRWRRWERRSSKFLEPGLFSRSIKELYGRLSAHPSSHTQYSQVIPFSSRSISLSCQRKKSLLVLFPAVLESRINSSALSSLLFLLDIFLKCLYHDTRE